MRFRVSAERAGIVTNFGTKVPSGAAGRVQVSALGLFRRPMWSPELTKWNPEGRPACGTGGTRESGLPIAWQDPKFRSHGRKA